MTRWVFGPDLSLAMKRWAEGTLRFLGKEIVMSLSPKEAVLKYFGLEGPYCLGLDVSRYQGDWDEDLAYQNGARFVIVRAGSIDSLTGQCYTDYHYHENMEKLIVSANNWRVGVYWFFRPNLDQIAQARYFTDLASLYPHVISMGLWHDIEISGGLASIRRPAETYLNEIDAKIEPINAPQGLYSNLNWDTFLGDWDRADRYRKWPAYWRTDSLTEPPRLPAGWDIQVDGKSWDIWQKLGDAEGFPKYGYAFGAQSEYIDISLANMNQKELRERYPILDQPLPPAPPPEPRPSVTVTVESEGDVDVYLERGVE